jgi:sulfide:quinone oxidoreductase
MKHVLIIGGGTGGIMTAAQLLKKKDIKVSLMEPAKYHYYQPAWTLVGANTYDYEKTKRTMESVMPSGVHWIKENAEKFDTANNAVISKEGNTYTYDYLVVSPGIKIDLTLIEGLEDALDKGVVCSNYTDPKHTWEVLKNFKGGNAVFTQPATPIKCGGAPQKIAYLAADYFRKNNLADKTNVVFATPGSVIFGVKEVRKTLEEVLKRYDIHFKPHYAPIKIDAKNKIVTFKWTDSSQNQCVVNEDNTLGETMTGEQIIEMPFDMLHLAPPQTAPDFVKNSELANEAGWLDVDIATLQHKKFANIFGIGDAAALPTAKTGAAIRKQVPVVVENITRLIEAGKLGSKTYNGYSSCPLVTGYGKMVLAEFDYDSNFTPDPKLKQMLVFNSAKEHRRLWWLKKYILPRLYWNKMLKGVDV